MTFREAARQAANTGAIVCGARSFTALLRWRAHTWGAPDDRHASTFKPKMKQITQWKGLLVAGSIGLIGVVGSEVVSAVGKPEPKLETAAAGDESVPGEAKPAGKVPSSNPLSGDPEAIDLGKRLYFTWCVQCHGVKANGESRFGKYAGDLTVFWRGYKEFVIIVKNGRTGRQMPPWKEVLDDDNIAKIGAYLETLAKEGANWK